MILKRQEKDNKIKAMYKSSTILASVFETDTKNLTVIFSNGGQYKYSNVALTDYTRFETADSQGVILNTHIKKYSFEKMSPIDTGAIIKEITDLSTADDKSSIETKTKVMFAGMNQLIANYIQNGKVDNIMLQNVSTAIVAYDKVANPTQVLA